MSSREHPNSGFTVNVIKIQKFLNIKESEQLETFLEEHDCEQALELIKKECKRLGLPKPYWLFYMGEETVPGEGLEKENWYVLMKMICTLRQKSQNSLNLNKRVWHQYSLIGLNGVEH